MGITYKDKLLFASILLIVSLSACNYDSIQPFCPQNAIEISDTIVVSASCGLNNGSISVTVIGDNVNLLYSIDSVDFQSTGSFENLSAGSYSLHCTTPHDFIIH